jgi:hypothetical protein
MHELDRYEHGFSQLHVAREMLMWSKELITREFRVMIVEGNWILEACRHAKSADE